MSAKKPSKWLVVLWVLLSVAWTLFCGVLTSKWIADPTPPFYFGDAAVPVTLVNDTDEPLQFHCYYYNKGFPYSDKGHLPYGGVVEELVPPHSQKTASLMVRGPSLRIVAEDPDGRKVFEHTYTWEELDHMRDDIVVSSLEPVE